MTAKRIGAPATLLVRRDTIEIMVGDGAERCVHPRRDGARVVQRLADQRDDMLGAVHGRRKQATFRRQCLVELGRVARDFRGDLAVEQGRWDEAAFHYRKATEAGSAVAPARERAVAAGGAWPEVASADAVDARLQARLRRACAG